MAFPAFRQNGGTATYCSWMTKTAFPPGSSACLLFSFGGRLLFFRPKLQALLPPSPLAVQFFRSFDLLVLAHVTSH
jgi:hypothetical protein